MQYANAAAPAGPSTRSTRLRAEITSLALLAVAVFVAGALLSSGRNPDAACWATQSRFGPLGGCLRTATFFLTGPWAASLLPLVPIVLAAHVAQRIEPRHARALLAFLAGCVVLLGTSVALIAGAHSGFQTVRHPAGVVGAGIAVAVVHVIGVLGTWLAVLLAFYMVARLSADRAGVDLTRTARVIVRRTARRRTRSGAASPLERRAAQTSRVTMIDTPDEPVEEIAALPSSELLLPSLGLQAEATPADREATEFRLVGALRLLRLDASVVGRSRGPAVTRYEIEVSPSTPIRDYVVLARDLTTALKCASIRVAPIAGRVTVGVEIPNAAVAPVSLRELIDSVEYRETSRLLPIALGRDVNGGAVIADLSKMPHLLLAGASGSGKTVSLNSAITSLVYRHSARTVRMLIIDTDDAGLSAYEHLPHLWGGVVTDYRTAATVLDAAVVELRARLGLFAASGARNLPDFNQRVADGAIDTAVSAPFLPLIESEYDGGQLPHLVIVVDDLGDLLRAAPEVEQPLVQLASKARMVGIHLVAATQHPVSEALSPAFLANFPARAALRVADATESCALVERAGAESLLGSGDMLFLPPGRSEPIRLQAPLMSTADTTRLVQWFARQAGITLPAAEPAPLAEPQPVVAQPEPAAPPTSGRSAA